MIIILDNNDTNYKSPARHRHQIRHNLQCVYNNDNVMFRNVAREVKGSTLPSTFLYMLKLIFFSSAVKLRIIVSSR